MRYFSTLLLLYFCLLFSFSSNAARVFGKVTASDGENMPFLTVYEEGTTYGTTTNQEGSYFLELSEGEHQIVFRYVGFQSQTHTVIIKKDENIELNIVMKSSTIGLKEVVITPNGEDPAYAVIREAQKKREFYRTQNKAFSCDVYIKNVQKLDEFKVPKILEDDDIEEFRKEWEKNKIVYFSESVSKYYFLAPNKRKEVVISSKVSGDSGGFSWNSALYLSFDIYENTIDAPIGDRPFVSPIAAGAMLYYEYQHEGEFMDKGVNVHKIRVFPRSKGQPLFSGLIYIQDSTWRVHSTDLEVSKDVGLEFIDKLSIKQTFVPIVKNNTDDIWLCSTQAFSFNYSIAMMGAKVAGHGNYTGSFSNYDVTPNFTKAQLSTDTKGQKLPNLAFSKKKKKKIVDRKETIENKNTEQEKEEIITKNETQNTEKDSISNLKNDLETMVLERKFFNKEISIVSDSSNLKSAEYWAKMRPVPLTSEENEHYVKSDSIEKAQKDPVYLDSMDRKANKFKIMDLLTGYTYRNRKRELTFNFVPITQNIQTNTVEGYVLNAGVNLRKFRERNFSTTQVSLNGRYGFSSNKFYAKGSFLHRFNQISNTYIYLQGGSFVQQFDGDAISPFMNSIYTLLREENYQKIFEKRFVQFNTGTRIFDGAFLRLEGAFEQRIPLQNANPTLKPYFDRDEIEFTQNLPIDFDGNNVFFEKHNSFIFKAQLRYKIGEKYMLRPKQRVTIPSNYPTFTLTYSQGVPTLFDSKTDFGQLLLNVKDDVSLGVVGSLNYEAQAGTFLWNNYTSFVDNFHFQTSPLLLAQSRLRQFLLLPYYQYSTTDNFAEIHAEHHFNGYLMNRIPLIKKLKWQFVAGAHYLYTPNTPNYTEVSVGFERIFKVLRVDAVWAVNPSLKNEIKTGLGTNFGLRLRFGF
ncbi:hypothetical protein Fleli_0758 [Bernardetia litoralis DSM 6794]|uniref:Carboxypeptidase-like regulatory domain-containing protein n=1 Tax=Bernardetia litoralis (strain ATCC 23117 / DSM 6794 / NBRC 15988 / NCIMB 1366 / Fx l1 / Sio-4) TaxID=880071 RepID=I4AGY3_BERLS|nr:DUF5686 family protein [Bernardetia litoralis]AFM03218.1 hypothetical protein Fleli_0758 [Bernardetia litoralis DSM 6794]